MAQNINTLGGVTSILLGPRTLYMITDPEDAFTVANTCLEKDDFYDFAESWLGVGLIIAKLSKWKVHRKLLNPAFSQVLVDRFIPIFDSQARKLVKEFDVKAGKGPFDCSKYIKHNNLETICLTALGVNFSDHKILNNQYVEALDLLLSYLVERLQKPWLHSNYIFKFSSLKRKQDDCLKTLHKLPDTVLQRRKSAKNEGTQKSIVKFKGSKIKPIMDLILELPTDKELFSDKEIRDHIEATIVGGHDTTATTLLYTLILLGSYPHVQEIAYAELKDIFQDSDREVEKSDITQMIYIEAILKESLRIYTLAPLIARRLDQNIKLKNCTLSSGRTCVLALFALNRHSVWGPDANEFKPERWLDPATLPENVNNVFSGFSFGKRMCIGKSYALVSMKTTLSNLIRNYTFKADHTKLVINAGIMIKPESGHHISLERRK